MRYIPEKKGLGNSSRSVTQYIAGLISLRIEFAIIFAWMVVPSCSTMCLNREHILKRLHHSFKLLTSVSFPTCLQDYGYINRFHHR